MKHSLLDEKLLRFIAVGTLNTLAGMAIMFGLYNLCGCSYWVSSAANYIIVSILSYVLNKTFTFGHNGEVIGSAMRFALNIAVCYVAAYGIAKPLMSRLLVGAALSMQENVAMIVGMCLFTGLNYIGQRLFVFGEKKMEYREIYERWVSSPSISEEERQQLEAMTDEEVYEAFYKYAEFGTAGMRGIMGLGTNRLNKYTIRMAAKGLAQLLGEGAKVAVAYDTRNNSVVFAEETAKVLAAAGIETFLFDRYSPVPLLSFAVRELNCDGGVVITASHNTKEYNGFKVYDKTGCQMNTEQAGKVAANIAALDDELTIETADIKDKNIKSIGEEIVYSFMNRIASLGYAEGVDVSDIDIVYTPIHGSGRDYVMHTLENAGFSNVTLIEEQAEFNGDFPTVKKPNPEDKAAFAIAEKVALESNADIIIGTDPDCDRIGIGVVNGDHTEYLSGNQTGALIIDYLARIGHPEGKKLITTIVTGEMGPMIAASYGVNVDKTLTGFKYIGGIMNSMDLEDYLMGYEESYGYLPGVHARDKDGVSTALVICRMAAYWKAQGKTLADVLEDLYAQHGYWIDRQVSFTFEGSEGEKKIKNIMSELKKNGEETLSKVGDIKEVLDYNEGIGGLPSANVYKYIFGNGSWVAARPSGTEPKIKFYYCVTGKNEDMSEKLYAELKEQVELLVNRITS